jgi:hypothetical protein
VTSIDDAVFAFTEAAVDWAGGGRGQPLVDAAAQALVDGLDSPTLRILAGAVHGTAEDEARDLAPTVFEELGIAVNDRLSPDAIVEASRQDARRFLANGGSTREFARDMWHRYALSDYADALSPWSGLDDLYDMLEHGVIAGRAEDVDAATIEAARALVERRQPEPFTLGALLTTKAAKPTAFQRLLRRGRS